MDTCNTQREKMLSLLIFLPSLLAHPFSAPCCVGFLDSFFTFSCSLVDAWFAPITVCTFTLQSVGQRLVLSFPPMMWPLLPSFPFSSILDCFWSRWLSLLSHPAHFPEVVLISDLAPLPLCYLDSELLTPRGFGIPFV